MRGWLVALLLVGACTQDAPPPEVVPPAPVVLEIMEPVVVPVIEPKPRFFLTQLMGLAPQTVEGILGTPLLRHKEKEAEVWLYKNAFCALHLYSYENENGDLRVDYVESTGHSGLPGRADQATDFCITSHLPEPSSGQSDTDLPPGTLGN